MNEREALALIESGKSVRDLIRDHRDELEFHMEIGGGIVARAKVDLITTPDGGEMVKAVSIVENEDGPGRFTAEIPIATAEAWLRRAVAGGWAQRAAKSATDFLLARGGSRDVRFARRFGAPVSKAQHPAPKLFERWAERRKREQTENDLQEKE